MYLTISNLTQYLISRGVLDPASIMDGDLMIVENRRRNRNFQVLRSRHSSLFVKQPAVFVPDTTLGMAREAACYRLASEDADFAVTRDVMPRMLEYNPANHTLVTELLQGSQNLNEFHGSKPAPPEDIGRLQGRALAQCHSCSLLSLARLDQVKLFPRIRPFVLSIWQNAESVMPNMSGGIQSLVAVLRQQPEVTQPLSRLWTEWRQTSLIHGDAKWDNFLIVQNGVESPFLKFIDWELSDIGDPVWDIAGVFTSYLQGWLISLGSPDSDDRFGAAPSRRVQAAWPGLRAFWDEYVRTMRFSSAQAQYQLVRCVSFTAARFIHFALELLQSSGQLTFGANLILRLAREILIDPPRAQFELLGLYPTTEFNSPPRHDAAVLSSQPSPKPIALATDGKDGALDEFSPSLLERLRSLSEDLAFISPPGFQFAGHPPVYFQNSEQGPRQPGATGIAEMDNGLDPGLAQMVEALWPTLYGQCYTREKGISLQRNGNESVGAMNGALGGTDSEFVASLSAANQSRLGWDRSWQVSRLDANGGAHVVKGDVYRLALPGEYAFLGGPGRLPAVGERVDLVALREGTKLQPGFYFAFGEAPWGMLDDALTSRIYFNVNAGTAGKLLRCVSRSLNRFNISFRFKCLDNKAALEHGRSDAAILYVPKRLLTPVFDLLRDECHDVLNELNPGTPLFSKMLLPGLSAADDPGTGESFGQSRMRLVSLGIITAWLQGRNDLSSRLQAISASFRRRGISLRAPHLNPGNTDLYQWRN